MLPVASAAEVLGGPECSSACDSPSNLPPLLPVAEIAFLWTVLMLFERSTEAEGKKNDRQKGSWGARTCKQHGDRPQGPQYPYLC